jgi:hypothetical protein
MILTQTLITAAVALLAAYRGALTRSSRLRGLIRADLELRDAFPEDSPTREKLTGHAEKLAGALMRREARQFEPIVPAGVSLGVHAAVTGILALAVTFSVLEVTGLHHAEPMTREEWGPALATYGGLMLLFAWFAFRAWRRAHAAR